MKRDDYDRAEYRFHAALIGLFGYVKGWAHAPVAPGLDDLENLRAQIAIVEEAKVAKAVAYLAAITEKAA